MHRTFFINNDATSFVFPIITDALCTKKGNFRDGSFHTIDCTGADNHKQANKTLHTTEI